ncbi:MAG: hypothetical protein QGF53_01720 [Alphaproteobacteria bacterium]|nr:hypothetical protein [Alphaproteobacteria bacterium]
MIALLVVVVGTARAQQVAIPVAPQLRVIVEPGHVLQGGAHVQGQIRLRVLLASPDPFAAIDFVMPEIAGAKVIELFPPKTRTINVYDKLGYAYETHLALFAESSGILTIPEITMLIAVTTPEGERQQFDLSNPAFDIPIHPIDPALQSSWWMVADKLEVSESWTPEPEAFRAGETIKRHVSIVAHGVSVAQLPHIEQIANQGYAVVGASQDTKTWITKEGLVAEVSQTWEMRLQTDDVLYVSPIVIHYWDAAADVPAVARLPSKRVEPLPRDPEASRRALLEEAMAAHRGRRLGALVLIAIPTVAGLALLAMFAYAARRTRADRQLLSACRGGLSPAGSLAAILCWSEASFGERGGHAVTALGRRLGGSAARTLAGVQATAFGAEERGIDSRDVSRVLVRAARVSRMSRVWVRLAAPFVAMFAAPRLAARDEQ